MSLILAYDAFSAHDLCVWLEKKQEGGGGGERKNAGYARETLR